MKPILFPKAPIPACSYHIITLKIDKLPRNPARLNHQISGIQPLHPQYLLSAGKDLVLVKEHFNTRSPCAFRFLLPTVLSNVLLELIDSACQPKFCFGISDALYCVCC